MTLLAQPSNDEPTIAIVATVVTLYSPGLCATHLAEIGPCQFARSDRLSDGVLRFDLPWVFLDVSFLMGSDSISIVSTPLGS